MATDYELSIVIPVFNEERNIGELLKDWQLTFQTIPIRHRFIIINDGSTDNSLSILQSIAGQMPGISLYTQTNAGHGPAILTGYKMALGITQPDQPGASNPHGVPATSDWIFQIDADHQHDPSLFPVLWQHRHEYDLLLGERKEKKATLARKWVSAASTGIVRLLYGSRVKDVNSPYRLMRSTCLKDAIPLIPRDSFAPNVLLTGWFVFFRSKIFTAQLPARSSGIQRPSKMNGYFLRGCFKSIFQTISFRFKL